MNNDSLFKYVLFCSEIFTGSKNKVSVMLKNNKLFKAASKFLNKSFPKT